MSSKELSRVEVLGRVKAGSVSLVEAAELLGLSYRQTKRVWSRFRAGGAKDLRHRGCGRESNRGYSKEFREHVLGCYRAAASEMDYHRQRPTARQLEEAFWLEEERW